MPKGKSENRRAGWPSATQKAVREIIAGIEARIEASQPAKDAVERAAAIISETFGLPVDISKTVEIIAQHAVTSPVFNAIIPAERERKNHTITAIESAASVFADIISANTAALKPFYDAVADAAAAIDDNAARADYLRSLCDGFYSAAFPETADMLGIAYTPVELVDYLVRSADALCKKHFGRGLADSGVNIIEPFAGTGTFIVRALEHIAADGGRDAVVMKYKSNEISAYEIMFIPYHVMLANVENAYQLLTGDYQPFEGGFLADTFALAEKWYEERDGDTSHPD